MGMIEIVHENSVLYKLITSQCFLRSLLKALGSSQASRVLSATMFSGALATKLGLSNLPFKARDLFSDLLFFFFETLHLFFFVDQIVQRYREFRRVRNDV